MANHPITPFYFFFTDRFTLVAISSLVGLFLGRSVASTGKSSSVRGSVACLARLAGGVCSTVGLVLPSFFDAAWVGACCVAKGVGRDSVGVALAGFATCAGAFSVAGAVLRVRLGVRCSGAACGAGNLALSGGVCPPLTWRLGGTGAAFSAGIGALPAFTALLMLTAVSTALFTSVARSRLTRSLPTVLSFGAGVMVSVAGCVRSFGAGGKA